MFLIHLNKMLMMRIIIIAIRQVNGIVQIRFHNRPSYLQTFVSSDLPDISTPGQFTYSVRFTTLPDGTGLSSTYELEVPYTVTPNRDSMSASTSASESAKSSASMSALASASESASTSASESVSTSESEKNPLKVFQLHTAH